MGSGSKRKIKLAIFILFNLRHFEQINKNLMLCNPSHYGWGLKVK